MRPILHTGRALTALLLVTAAAALLTPLSASAGTVQKAVVRGSTFTPDALRVLLRASTCKR